MSLYFQLLAKKTATELQSGGMQQGCTLVMKSGRECVALKLWAMITITRNPLMLLQM